MNALEDCARQYPDHRTLPDHPQGSSAAVPGPETESIHLYGAVRDATLSKIGGSQLYHESDVTSSLLTDPDPEENKLSTGKPEVVRANSA